MDHSVRVRLIEDDTEWDNLASDWSHLFKVSSHSSPPLHFDWLRTWWRIYGPVYGAEDRGLRIITVWRGPSLLGLLPLYRNPTGRVFGLRRLGFLSTGELEFEETYPEYLNLLCLPGEETICLDAFRLTLRRLTWDHLELLDVPGGSPLMQLSAAAAKEGRLVAIPRGSCFIANVEGGFDVYLGRLSAKPRQQARRLLRESEKSGAILELANGADTERFFGELVRLHQERWIAEGKPGCFASSRFTEFHHSLAKKWVPSGEAVLARLSLNNEPLALLYGFINGSKFDEYQTGVKMNYSKVIHSPGILARLLLMIRLSERGITRYDFLRGSLPYKTAFATEGIPLFALHCWRHSVRSTVFGASRLLGRGSWKGLTRLLGERLGVSSEKLG